METLNIDTSRLVAETSLVEDDPEVVVHVFLTLAAHSRMTNLRRSQCLIVRSWVVSKCVVYIYQTCTKNNLDTNNTNYGVVLVMNPEVEILHCLRTPRSTILRLAYLVRSVNRLRSYDGSIGLSTRYS